VQGPGFGPQLREKEKEKKEALMTSKCLKICSAFLATRELK